MSPSCVTPCCQMSLIHYTILDLLKCKIKSISRGPATVSIHIRWENYWEWPRAPTTANGFSSYGGNGTRASTVAYMYCHLFHSLSTFRWVDLGAFKSLQPVCISVSLTAFHNNEQKKRWCNTVITYINLSVALFLSISVRICVHVRIWL